MMYCIQVRKLVLISPSGILKFSVGLLQTFIDYFCVNSSGLEVRGRL